MLNFNYTIVSFLPAFPDILHRYKKSVQIIVYVDVMGSNYDKNQTNG